MDDLRKRRPLHLATARGNLPVVRYLLRAGCDVDAVDWAGRSPLHLAAQEGAVDCTKCLISYGADVNGRDSDNANPLHLTTLTPIIEILLKNGADPTVQMVDMESRKMSVFRGKCLLFFFYFF